MNARFGTKNVLLLTCAVLLGSSTLFMIGKQLVGLGTAAENLKIEDEKLQNRIAHLERSVRSARNSIAMMRRGEALQGNKVNNSFEDSGRPATQDGHPRTDSEPDTICTALSGGSARLTFFGDKAEFWVMGIDSAMVYQLDCASPNTCISVGDAGGGIRTITTVSVFDDMLVYNLTQDKHGETGKVGGYTKIFPAECETFEPRPY